jgi:nifR3 family TIM-barrel protein
MRCALQPSPFIFAPDSEHEKVELPPPLQLGNLTIAVPVVVSPMAGITSYPFRKLCSDHGAGLFVSEMLLAKNVAAGKPDGRARFGPGETPRSAQLYGTDPGAMGAAAERLILEQDVQHIDCNFGCPAPKVLKKGGGAAIPANNPSLLRAIVTAVVDAAAPHGVPVTAKIRLGLDAGSYNYISSGLAMQDCGAAGVVLHARTASDLYSRGSGRAGWPHIATLVRSLDIPVVGNGDIFTARDAVAMLECTGAAGVAVGRGCLGRPWLFRDLARVFEGVSAEMVTMPGVEEVSRTLMEHVEAIVAWQAEDGVDEESAVASMRKWHAWYWMGANVPDGFVQQLCRETTVNGIRSVLESIAESAGKDIAFDIGRVIEPRGKTR